MLKKLLSYLEYKKIVILGFGIEGEATYNFLRRNFPDKKLFIADRNINLLEKHKNLEDDMDLEISIGDNYLNGIEEYDLIIKAPGISLKDVDISKYEYKITSELELFLEFVNVFTIGITGTKGKSTTSTLLYKVLQDQKKDSYLLGNIGEPIFNDIELFTENTIAVIELSSHALEFVKKSPNIAILLDVFEEHLDHYKSLEKYIEAKYNVAKYQKDNDVFIFNYDNELMKKYSFEYKENDYRITLGNRIDNIKNQMYINDEYIYYNDNKLMNINEKINLKGIHNINNIMFILATSIIINLDINKVIDSIKDFLPLEHRMEYVGNINEIDYYNDSIATIPESTINAINSIPDIDTLIVGGKDRGVNLDNFIEFLRDTDICNIICLPKTGEYISQKLNNSGKEIFFVQELKDAVEIAKEKTKKGKVCLLSPAASSYGYFKNFEERGMLFKKYVKN